MPTHDKTGELIAMLNDIGFTAAQPPSGTYPKRVIHLSVEDECDAGSEERVGYDLDMDDVKALLEALHAPASADLAHVGELDGLFANTIHKDDGSYRVYMSIEQRDFWTAVNEFFRKRQNG